MDPWNPCGPKTNNNNNNDDNNNNNKFFISYLYEYADVLWS